MKAGYKFRSEAPTLRELWARYKAINSLLEDLRIQQDAGFASQWGRIYFEDNVLGPILHQMHELAMQIARAKCSQQAEVAIKAAVLLDYLDTEEGDTMQTLAQSLCVSALELSS